MRSIMAGYGMQVIVGVWLMTCSLDTAPLEFALNGVLQGFAGGVIWVPLTIITFSNVRGEDLDETTSVYHLLRNIGSSFFISMTVTELVRSTATNYEYLTEHISPFNPMLKLPWVLGQWDVDTVEGLARLSKEMVHQAALISYLNAFGMLAVASAVAIPLILMARQPSKKAG
jgi:DHA2 family multidrug resistance protein